MDQFPAMRYQDPDERRPSSPQRSVSRKTSPQPIRGGTLRGLEPVTAVAHPSKGSNQLSVHKGCKLQVIDSQGQWVWCRANGSEGWLPKASIAWDSALEGRMVGISKNGVNPPVSCSGRRGVVGQTRTPAGSASVGSGGACRDGARSPGGSRSESVAVHTDRRGNSEGSANVKPSVGGKIDKILSNSVGTGGETETPSLPERWTTLLSRTMVLHTVQNAVRLAQYLLQLLLGGYGTVSALHIACWEGSVDAVAAVTSGSLGRIKDWHSRQGDLTPLHIATLCGHASVVDYLLQLGVDQNVSTVHDICALHISATSSPELCEVLLSGKADPSSQTADADTPLHFACCFQQVSTIELLLQAGVDASWQNVFGISPLHVAAAYAALEGTQIRDSKAVLLLCSRRADPSARDRHGRRPADVVQVAGGDPTLLDFFLSDGSEPAGTRTQRLANKLLASAVPPSPEGTLSTPEELEEESLASEADSLSRTKDLRRVSSRNIQSLLGVARPDLLQEDADLARKVAKMQQELEDSRSSHKLLEELLVNTKGMMEQIQNISATHQMIQAPRGGGGPQEQGGSRELDGRVNQVRSELKVRKHVECAGKGEEVRREEELGQKVAEVAKKIADLETLQLVHTQRCMDGTVQNHASKDTDVNVTRGELVDCGVKRQRDVTAQDKELCKNELEQHVAELGERLQDMQVLRNHAERHERADRLSMEKRIHELQVAFDTEQALRKLYHNQLLDFKGAIRVYARIRPVVDREEGQTIVVRKLDAFTVETAGKEGRHPKTFTFDSVFDGHSSQDEVFSECKGLVSSAVDGYNVTIFAYGQTGSGKTHTMFGNEAAPGLVPRIADELFVLIHRYAHERDTQVRCQMFELYRDDLVDLFLPIRAKGMPLDIKRDARGSVYVDNATECEVRKPEDLLKLVADGCHRRHVAATKMNCDSSRSHLVVTVVVELTNRKTKQVSTGKLTLCDLAGSERLKKSDSTGDQMKEAQAINKSLAALGDVIEALTKNTKHVPYRNHKLTQLLSDSIGGNAKTLMFVNCSPVLANLDETTSSLVYAVRAKLIINKVEKNEDTQEVARLKKVIQVMSKELEQTRAKGMQLPSGPRAVEAPDA